MQRSEKLKGALGPVAYVAGALIDPLPTVADFRITLDDGVLETRGIAVLVVNFAQIFPDFSITHNNDAADGLFEVVVLRQQNAVELLPALFAAWLDSVSSWPDRGDAIELRHSSYVRVESDPPLSVQYDGEPLPLTTPFEAQILPSAARFVVE